MRSALRLLFWRRKSDELFTFLSTKMWNDCVLCAPHLFANKTTIICSVEFLRTEAVAGVDLMTVINFYRRFTLFRMLCVGSGGCRERTYLPLRFTSAAQPIWACPVPWAIMCTSCIQRRGKKKLAAYVKKVGNIGKNKEESYKCEMVTICLHLPLVARWNWDRVQYTHAHTHPYIANTGPCIIRCYIAITFL